MPMRQTHQSICYQMFVKQNDWLVRWLAACCFTLGVSSPSNDRQSVIQRWAFVLHFEMRSDSDLSFKNSYSLLFFCDLTVLSWVESSFIFLSFANFIFFSLISETMDLLLSRSSLVRFAFSRFSSLNTTFRSLIIRSFQMLSLRILLASLSTSFLQLETLWSRTPLADFTSLTFSSLHSFSSFMKDCLLCLMLFFSLMVWFLTSTICSNFFLASSIVLYCRLLSLRKQDIRLFIIVVFSCSFLRSLYSSFWEGGHWLMDVSVLLMGETLR